MARSPKVSNRSARGRGGWGRVAGVVLIVTAIALTAAALVGLYYAFRGGDSLAGH